MYGLCAKYEKTIIIFQTPTSGCFDILVDIIPHDKTSAKKKTISFSKLLVKNVNARNVPKKVN